jgi:hypothetical protein
MTMEQPLLPSPSSSLPPHLSSRDIAIDPDTRIVQFSVLPPEWRTYMKAAARHFIDQHDLASVFQLHIPWGITDKTVGSLMSSQRFYVSFEPVIQEAMREALHDRDLNRPHIIFSRPCPASMERPCWTIAFIL